MTPHNPDAERSVLACLLNDQDGTLTDQAIAAGLRQDTFYNSAHSAIFAAIAVVRGRDAIPDTVSVCHQLNSTGELDLCGGASGVLGVANAGGSLASWKTHVEILLCLASQRAALSHLKQAEKALEVEYSTRDELNDAVQPKLAWVQNSLARQERVESLSSIVDRIVADTDLRMAGKAPAGIQIEWGLPVLDKHLTPIERYEIALIAARPKIGKSSLVRHIVHHNLRRGLRFAVFMLESTALKFVEGMAAAEAKVSVKQIAEEMSHRQKAFAEALLWTKRLDSLKIYDRDLTLDAIEARCRVLKDAFRPDGIVIDHFHQLQISVGKGQSTADAMASMSRRLIALQRHMGCPIIVAAQLNRESETEGNRQPKPSDLRGTGALEQDCHRCCFVHKPAKDKYGQDQIYEARDTYEYQIIQGLMRDGPTPCINVAFKSRWAGFEQLSPDK